MSGVFMFMFTKAVILGKWYYKLQIPMFSCYGISLEDFYSEC